MDTAAGQVGLGRRWMGTTAVGDGGTGGEAAVRARRGCRGRGGAWSARSASGETRAEVPAAALLEP